MCKRQMLRALVQQRLTAAAEDIFGLFERTIADFEEELCRFKEENQRKQELLELLLASGVQMPPQSLQQEVPETLHMKEEPEDQSVKQEEEQLPVDVCVKKTEERSLIQHGQTEPREDTEGEDVSAEPSSYLETEGDTGHSDTRTDEDWGAPFSRSAAQVEAEADGDKHFHMRARSAAAQSSSRPSRHSVNDGDMPGTAEGWRHQCSFCNRRFGRKHHLQAHVRIHTGEKPYSCSICKKSFSQSSNLDVHKRTHTGERPYSCSACTRTFMRKGDLDLHVRTHTGEKPFSCSVCNKTFAKKANLKTHIRLHLTV